MKEPIDLLDVGCGGRSHSGLMCSRGSRNYCGIDFSPEAIQIAGAQWPNTNFKEMSYEELTPEFTEKYNLLLANALHNVLPNGDECMETPKSTHD